MRFGALRIALLPLSVVLALPTHARTFRNVKASMLGTPSDEEEVVTQEMLDT